MKNLYMLKSEFLFLQSRYHVGNDIVYDVIYSTERPNCYGHFDYYNKIICIDPNYSNLSYGRKILYHEFRHAWQLANFHDIFFWWINHGGEYLDYYESVLNSLEYDASVFGNSYGMYNAEFALSHYDAEDLNLAYISNSLNSLEEYLTYLYKDKIKKINKYHSFRL